MLRRIFGATSRGGSRARSDNSSYVIIRVANFDRCGRWYLIRNRRLLLASDLSQIFVALQHSTFATISALSGRAGHQLSRQLAGVKRTFDFDGWMSAFDLNSSSAILYWSISRLFGSLRARELYSIPLGYGVVVGAFPPPLISRTHKPTASTTPRLEFIPVRLDDINTLSPWRRDWPITTDIMLEPNVGFRCTRKFALVLVKRQGDRRWLVSI